MTIDLVVVVDITTEYRRRWLEVADVICCGEERLPCPAPQWIARVMRRYPGVAIAAVTGGPGASLLGLRDGRMFSVECGQLSPRLVAAWVYQWLATGNRVETLTDADRSLRDPIRIGLGRWDRGQ